MPATMTPEEHAGYDGSARWLDVAETALEALVAIDHLRRRAWSEAKGPLVLEIGIGSGRGLRYHPPGTRVVAFDFSPSMLKRAAAKAKRTGARADLLIADVNFLPFKSGVFDTVLATFVFCMVPDPIGALSEAARPCRSDGQMLLLEHVRPDFPLLGKAADILNRFTVRGGEHVNRDTAGKAREAGLELLREKKYRMGIVKLLQARPGVGAAALMEKEGKNVAAS